MTNPKRDIPILLSFAFFFAGGWMLVKWLLLLVQAMILGLR